jgi:hypothetical protein
VIRRAPHSFSLQQVQIKAGSNSVKAVIINTNQKYTPLKIINAKKESYSRIQGRAKLLRSEKNFQENRFREYFFREGRIVQTVETALIIRIFPCNFAHGLKIG